MIYLFVVIGEAPSYGAWFTLSLSAACWLCSVKPLMNTDGH
jgi:hypothetical protein